MLKKDLSTNEKKQNNRRFLSGVMKILLIILIIAVISIIILFSTKLNNISIEGNNHYSKEDIIELLTSRETDKNTLLFYLRHEFDEDENIPFIEKVDVKLISRNEVSVQVYEKIVTGTIEYMDSYMYFDREGIVVETSVEKIDNIPLVSGLKFNELILHQPIKVDKPDVFQVVLNLTQLIHSYLLDINTIYFTSNLEVILYTDNIRVLLGKEDKYDEHIAQLANLLSSLKEQNEQLVGQASKKLVIDMREFEEGQDKIIAIPVE